MEKTLLLGLCVTVGLLSVHADHTDKGVVQAFTGNSTILECLAKGARMTDSTGVYWTRMDLKSPQYVFFYKNGHSDTTHQDSRYTNRVELAWPNLENNNLSLIIHNVSATDNGTFKCMLIQGGTSRANTFDVPPIRTLELIVNDLSKELDEEFIENNHVAWYIQAIVGFFFVAAIAALLFFFQRLHAHYNKSSQSERNHAQEE
ncbi:hypothetical protein WMY93_014783 [Mugilogobius chulae]|uniref:Ig-like domain-containing protein n=1 Tax=Mugilogobius chulae TaxID=88201 RepID=A0AAW0NXV2_9GOBI